MPDFDPILNIPYKEPSRYYETLPDGSLDYEKIRIGRRPYMPFLYSVLTKKNQKLSIKVISQFGEESMKMINLS